MDRLERGVPANSPQSFAGFWLRTQASRDALRWPFPAVAARWAARLAGKLPQAEAQGLIKVPRSALRHCDGHPLMTVHLQLGSDCLSAPDQEVYSNV